MQSWNDVNSPGCFLLPWTHEHLLLSFVGVGGGCGDTSFVCLEAYSSSLQDCVFTSSLSCASLTTLKCQRLRLFWRTMPEATNLPTLSTWVILFAMRGNLGRRPSRFHCIVRLSIGLAIRKLPGLLKNTFCWHIHSAFCSECKINSETKLLFDY